MLVILDVNVHGGLTRLPSLLSTSSNSDLLMNKYFLIFKAEILSALRQLGEKLSPMELQFLEQNSTGVGMTQHFIQVSENTGLRHKAEHISIGI